MSDPLHDLYRAAQRRHETLTSEPEPLERDPIRDLRSVPEPPPEPEPPKPGPLPGGGARPTPHAVDLNDWLRSKARGGPQHPLDAA